MNLAGLEKYKKIYMGLIYIFAAVFIVNTAFTIAHRQNFRAKSIPGSNDTAINFVSSTADLNTNYDGYVVKFADPNFANLIRFNLKMVPGENIHVKDVKKISFLNLNHCDITNLGGIEYFFSLKKLDISFNNISDLSQLSKLNNLEELVAYNNKISDVTEIGKITTLKKLDVSSNLITDITPLSNLKNLEELDVNNNRISNADVLANLPNLTVLDVARNNITNLDALKARKIKLFLSWGNKTN